MLASMSSAPLVFTLVSRDPPQFPPSLPSRFLMTAIERGVALFRSTVNVDSKLASSHKTHSAYVALWKLYNTHGEFYSGTVVDEYLKVLREIHPSGFYYSQEGIIHPPKMQKTPFQIAMEIYKEVYLNTLITDIAIPYDANAHHVVIYVDLRGRKIEYYDPLGVTSKQRRCECTESFIMRDQLEAIQNLFFDSANSVIVENASPHQRCCFRCAIWGLYYIDKRLSGRSAEELSAETITNDAIDSYKINVLAERIRIRAERIFNADAMQPSNSGVFVLE